MESSIRDYLKDVRLIKNPSLIAKLDAQRIYDEIKSKKIQIEPLGSLAQLMLEEFRNDVTDEVWLARFIEKDKNND